MNLSGTAITAKALQHLPAGLDLLVLVDCPALGNDIVKYLPKNVHTLHLAACPKVTIDIAAEREDIGVLKSTAPQTHWHSWFDLLSTI